MAKGDYYFPLFYKRLLASTIGWTDEEFGIYIRLLIYQFDNGSIPEDLKELKRISPKIKKNWNRISKKFIKKNEGELINLVMDEIRKDIEYKKEINQLHGKKGGRPKTKRLSESEPNGFPTETKRVTQMKPIPIINNKESIQGEREAPTIFYTIEHCLTVAMNDGRFVNANKTNEKELAEFNKMLERGGIYDKNPADYKDHFSKWKARGKKEIKPEENQGIPKYMKPL